MASDSDKNQLPDWQKLTTMGLARLLEFWKDGEPKSKDYRLTAIVFAFLKRITNDLGAIRKDMEYVREKLISEEMNDESPDNIKTDQPEE